MAKKNDIKKISINQLENIMKEKEDEITIVEWNGLELAVKYSLSLAEVKAFVDVVVDICFDENENFIPEFKQLAIDNCIVSLYANVRMPQDASRMHDILNKTRIIDEVAKYIDPLQLSVILDAINSKIEYKVNSNIKIAEKRINDMVSLIEDIGEKADEIFENLGDDGLARLVNSVENLEIENENIIHNYIDRKLDE